MPGLLPGINELEVKNNLHSPWITPIVKRTHTPITGKLVVGVFSQIQTINGPTEKPIQP